jgi:uncharacterized ferredoxin-like protein
MKMASELEMQAALQVAGSMAAAARTAPKTRGIDNLKVIAIDDVASRELLVARMREIGRAEGRPSFERDANCVSASPAIVVLAIESNTAGLNCGYCGQATCESLENSKGVCAFNSIDLGIAAGSAVTMAADSRVDTRIMFSVGRASLALGWFGPRVTQALGIPLSITGKSPFFDRKT